MTVRDYAVVHLTAAWVVALSPRRGEDAKVAAGVDWR